MYKCIIVSPTTNHNPSCFVLNPGSDLEGDLDGDLGSDPWKDLRTTWRVEVERWRISSARRRCQYMVLIRRNDLKVTKEMAERKKEKSKEKKRQQNNNNNNSRYKQKGTKRENLLRSKHTHHKSHTRTSCKSNLRA